MLAACVCGVCVWLCVVCVCVCVCVCVYVCVCVGGYRMEILQGKCYTAKNGVLHYTPRALHLPSY